MRVAHRALLALDKLEAVRAPMRTRRCERADADAPMRTRRCTAIPVLKMPHRTSSSAAADAADALQLVLRCGTGSCAPLTAWSDRCWCRRQESDCTGARVSAVGSPPPGQAGPSEAQNCSDAGACACACAPPVPSQRGWLSPRQPTRPQTERRCRAAPLPDAGLQRRERCAAGSANRRP